MAKQKFYVVWKGRRAGIFHSWAECSAQVTGYPDAEFKAFESLSAAEAAFRASYADYKGKPASSGQWLFAPNPPILPSLCVDAACDGSPGNLEYRGVDTETGKQIFIQGPYDDGTNNVGEFLAIVHALAWLEKQGKKLPIYSDSENAIAWVKVGKCRTKLERTGRNDVIFDLIARAEKWLAVNYLAQAVVDPVETPPGKIAILKWDTKAWGEIPADFGRK